MQWCIGSVASGCASSADVWSEAEPGGCESVSNGETSPFVRVVELSWLCTDGKSLNTALPFLLYCICLGQVGVLFMFLRSQSLHFAGSLKSFFLCLSPWFLTIGFLCHLELNSLGEVVLYFRGYCLLQLILLLIILPRNRIRVGCGVSK